MPRPLLTLTTDFGHSDPFAGTMKGVIYSIAREVEIADITHGIAAFDCWEVRWRSRRLQSTILLAQFM